jgi:RHS repeat-associated protein
MMVAQVPHAPQLTNFTGAATDSYEYDAYGNEFTVSGSTPNNYMYRGEQYDSDLGLYYLRARYYNPLTGRFMSRDPLDGDMTDPKSLHKYLYAAGDPVNRADPSGRDLIEFLGTEKVHPYEVEYGMTKFAFRLGWCFSTAADIIQAIINKELTFWAAYMGVGGVIGCVAP